MKIKIITFLILLIFVSASHAGKIKSSKSMIPIISEKISEANKQLDSINEILYRINKVSGFVKTDFFGKNPAWYFNNNNEYLDVSMKNYSGYLNSNARYRSGNKKTDVRFVRTIKGIKLVPHSEYEWTKTISYIIIKNLLK